MRMRPASFTAAAPPSSCQVTHSVRPMEVSASNSSPAPMRMSLVEREAVASMDQLSRPGLNVPNAGSNLPHLTSAPG